MRLEGSHASQKDLTHLPHVHGVEKKVIWIGGDINFVNAGLCPTKKEALGTERVC